MLLKMRLTSSTNLEVSNSEALSKVYLELPILRHVSVHQSQALYGKNTNFVRLLRIIRHCRELLVAGVYKL